MPIGGDNSVAQAARRLVSLPLAARMAVRHERRFLDLYRPNETPYLAAEFRARMLDSLGKVAWREKPAFDRMLAALVLRALALEDAFDASALRNSAGSCRWSDPTPRRGCAHPLRALTDAVIVSCLAEPMGRGVRQDVLLLWHVRGVVLDLVNRNRTSTLSSQLFALCDQIAWLLAR